MKPISGRSLWELICLRAEANPDSEMLADDHGTRVSFSEFKTRAEKMAAGFCGMGLQSGDVVSWQLPTWVDSLVLSAALNRIGVVQNPIIPIYREREVGFCAKEAKSKLLIVPGEFRGFDFGEMADGIAAGLDGLSVLNIQKEGFPSGDPSILPEEPAAPDSPEDLPVRWLMYTSGTTADPKGAKHTDASIAAVSMAMAERLECVPEDRSILAFPFTHIGGITWLFTSLQFGLTKLLTEAFDPEKTVSFMSLEGVTIAGSGTPFHQAYLNAQSGSDKKLFPNVRCFPGGGAPKPPQMHYDIKEAFGGSGIVSGWGLTEAPILTMGAVADPDDKLAETEGRPMPGVDLKVVAADGQTVGPEKEGELRVKAPQVMKGYLNSELDAEAFDEDGYFRTGDLGMVDKEGFVTITGRLKDVIIRHGENISAKEIEDLLYNHEKVEDVAVIGLDDEKTGERVCAIVSAPAGGEPISFEEMKDYLISSGLRKQAVPEQLEYIDAVPRNPSGKILKQDLRDTYSRKPFSRQ